MNTQLIDAEILPKVGDLKWIPYDRIHPVLLHDVVTRLDGDGRPLYYGPVKHVDYMAAMCQIKVEWVA